MYASRFAVAVCVARPATTGAVKVTRAYQCTFTPATASDRCAGGDVITGDR